MNDKYKFEHELPKDQSPFTGKVSSPLCLAELLTKLLQINETKGKIVYDVCIGVGALSSRVDTSKHILIGDDQELEYLKQCQTNNPPAILFNHDTLKCQNLPCYQHLISPEWKEKVEKHLEQVFGKKMINFWQLGILNGKSSEEIKKAEAQAHQLILEFLILLEQRKKAND